MTEEVSKGTAKIASGCRDLDELLGGGFEVGIISQIYGGSGSGKTNLCIQLAIECVKKGKKAIYIDTEGFSAERFKQIAGEKAEEIARDIIIYEPGSFEQQYSSIRDIEKIIKEDIGVIILDSAALYYRFSLVPENGGKEKNIALRRELANQIGLLYGLARKYGVAVVISNQVYTDVETGELCPVGGNMMEHLSKTILQLERVGNSRRRAILKKHRSRPEGISCEFTITQQGIQ